MGEDLKVIVGWVLGVPAIIGTLVATITALTKNRRETRKLDLEILQKERELGVAQRENNPAAVASIVAEPIFEGRRAQSLILRFVLLYLVLQAWALVGNLLAATANSARFGLSRSFESDSFSGIVVALLLALVASAATIVRSFLFVLIGWPLLLDICQQLRLDLPRAFHSRWLKRLLLVFSVVAALMFELPDVFRL